jgi:hypothetical protein
MFNYRKGKKHTEETRAKMSSSKAGETNPMFGKLCREKTRTKISAKNGTSKAFDVNDL